MSKTMKDSINTLRPRVHIICLDAQREGYVYGKWIDAHQPLDDLMCDIQDLLHKSPIHESKEWAIHDCKDFAGLSLRETMTVHEISDLAGFIVEHSALGAALYAYTKENLTEARRLINECYYGAFNSEGDFARQWVHKRRDSGIPFYLQPYIDYQAIARDLLSDDFFSIRLTDVFYILHRR